MSRPWPTIDEQVVTRLVAAQFPQWAEFPVTAVRSSGTDNAMFRLGEDIVARLPLTPGAARDVAKEQRWLPSFAPRLPLAIPAPLAKGAPGEEFPHPWSVYRWLAGANAVEEPIVDLQHAATRLGRFVKALRCIDATGGPPSFRGGHVSTRDAEVRAAIRQLGAGGLVDPHLVTTVWETSCAAPPWNGASVWLHADLHPANLLTRRGRLSAVIDFGGLGVGDPACDMLPAWTLLTEETRGAFRVGADADDETWLRGRGWGLCLGLGAVHVYRVTNPVLAGIGQHALREALADYRRTA